MRSQTRPVGLLRRVGLGLAVGGAIVYVDNFASQGEVSPFVIVAMLFSATAAAGAILGPRAWVVSLAEWGCVPTAHVIKHLWHLPDTLHPNTYASIAYLAAFTLAIAAIGTSSGVLVRRVLATGAGGSKPVN